MGHLLREPHRVGILTENDMLECLVGVVGGVFVCRGCWASGVFGSLMKNTLRTLVVDASIVVDIGNFFSAV